HPLQSPRTPYVSLVPIPRPAHHPVPPSFPTRRSSDLEPQQHLVPVGHGEHHGDRGHRDGDDPGQVLHRGTARRGARGGKASVVRSEEHTSELQSRENLVCRLLLEKKNKTTIQSTDTDA